MPVRSELDSKRFGVEVYRATPENAAETATLAQQQWPLGADLLVIRVPTTRLGCVQSLEREGAQLCDTLVFWSCPGDAFVPATDGAISSPVRMAEPTDMQTVVSLATASFQDFAGHYHTDPRLDRDRATEGYGQWAGTLMERSDAFVLLASHGGRDVGFLCATLDAEGNGEIVLNGVVPEGRGHGVYGALVDAAGRELLRRGSKVIASSTQVGNLAPQRAWARRGLRPTGAMHTLHLWLDDHR